MSISPDNPLGLALRLGSIISIEASSSPYGNLRFKVTELTEDSILLELIKDVELV